MTFILKIAKLIFNIIYKIFTFYPQQDKVIFLRQQSNSPTEDIVMLSNKINQLHPKCKVKILCKNVPSSFIGRALYCFHILSQLFHIATSKVVILDSYSIVSLIKNPRPLVIQMWHSIGTMKQFGYSTINKKEGHSKALATAMNMHKNYDFILSSGEGYVDHLCKGFGYTKKHIKVLPLPRVESLLNPDTQNQKRSKIYLAYPELEKGFNILYAPTYRKDPKEHLDFITALSQLEDAFKPYSDKVNFIVKAHPLSNVSSKYDKFSTADFLAVADVMISDYSCIVYEAAILEIPLYFYAYDFNEYMKDRDTYIDYLNDLPTSPYFDSNSLVNNIMSHVENNNYDMDALRKFRNKFISISSKTITEDIVNFIWENSSLKSDK